MDTRNIIKKLAINQPVLGMTLNCHDLQEGKNGIFIKRPITLSKDKLNDKPPEIVKCDVTRREDGPNQIVVYDDMLFAMLKHFPGMLDEVDGLSAFIGILVDKKTSFLFRSQKCGK